MIKNNEGYYAKYNNQTMSTGDDIAKTGMLNKIPKENLIKKEMKSDD